MDTKTKNQIDVEITDRGIAFIIEAPKPIQDQFMDRLLTLDEDKIAIISSLLPGSQEYAFMKSIIFPPFNKNNVTYKLKPSRVTTC